MEIDPEIIPVIASVDKNIKKWYCKFHTFKKIMNMVTMQLMKRSKIGSPKDFLNVDRRIYYRMIKTYKKS